MAIMPTWGTDPWAVAILDTCQRKEFPHSHWNPETGAEIVHTRFYTSTIYRYEIPVVPSVWFPDEPNVWFTEE